ncbi:MAG: aspartate/glutamate racemase family protein [Gorillibacterium sp.]|nr:aspartate/glutamate racemase family protein [Gorillibacterium sp.]
MKTIGLLGGMSWNSSAEYYRMMNELVQQRLGGQNSAKCILYSVNFAEIEQCQQEGRWQDAGKILVNAALSLENAGADALVLCTNTMHRLAEEITSSIHIPFLHIAQAAVEEIQHKKLRRVGLLGTRFTMEQEFYRGVLEKNGLEVIIPDEKNREIVHRVIYEELCKGNIQSISRDQFIHIMNLMVVAGAEGIILGCTEISLLVKPEDASVPLFDTTFLHAKKAVDFALQTENRY